MTTGTFSAGAESVGQGCARKGFVSGMGKSFQPRVTLLNAKVGRASRRAVTDRAKSHNSASKLAQSKRFASSKLRRKESRASVWSAGARSRFLRGAKGRTPPDNRRSTARTQQRQQAGAVQTLRVVQARAPDTLSDSSAQPSGQRPPRDHFARGRALYFS